MELHAIPAWCAAGHGARTPMFVIERELPSRPRSHAPGKFSGKAKNTPAPAYARGGIVRERTVSTRLMAVQQPGVEDNAMVNPSMSRRRRGT